MTQPNNPLPSELTKQTLRRRLNSFCNSDQSDGERSYFVDTAMQLFEQEYQRRTALAKPEGFNEVVPATDYSRGAIDAIDQYEHGLKPLSEGEK